MCAFYMSLRELIKSAEEFLRLADEMYRSGKITYEEYYEMTFIKKNFIDNAKYNAAAQFRKQTKDIK